MHAILHSDGTYTLHFSDEWECHYETTGDKWPICTMTFTDHHPHPTVERRDAKMEKMRKSPRPRTENVIVHEEYEVLSDNSFKITCYTKWPMEE